MSQRIDMDFPVAGYRLCQGNPGDRSILATVMGRTYQELGQIDDISHVRHTVDQHLSDQTPLWWVFEIDLDGASAESQPVACLWLGTAVDQLHGDRHAYLFLIYVDPAHRRRGIGLALMQQAHQWSRAQGDRQISLQVYENSSAAIALYKKLGYSTTARLMVRSFFGKSTQTKTLFP
ncbi:MAG: GNAT family N-acetyltransferase [Cyanobacteria bacterium P01_H01_bin.119]